jgi:CubicO group peptidase (beta-lactamase class C family)
VLLTLLTGGYEMKRAADTVPVLIFLSAWLLRPPATEAQVPSPQRSDGDGRPARACQAPRASFQQVLARGDSVFEGVGSQAAILYRGDRLVTVENGFSDLEHRVPVTADTRFPIASVTKAFTGMALLRLQEDGRIDLDRPIQDFVPAFPEKQGVITPRLLAAHVGGVRHYEEGERTPNFLFTHFDRVTDALTLFSEDSLAAAPGTRFIYSSYGYNLLAAAISGAADEDFAGYVRRVIVEPLGLQRTQFDDVRRPVGGRARGYTYYYPWYSRSADSLLMRVPDFDYSYNMGGGNMLATARDLVYVGRAAIRPGLLASESVLLLSEPIRPAASRWSYGWVVGHSAGRMRLRAEGSVPGYQATIEAYPAEDLVVAFLQNSWGRFPSDPANAPETMRDLVMLCLGDGS